MRKTKSSTARSKKKLPKKNIRKKSSVKAKKNIKKPSLVKNLVSKKAKKIIKPSTFSTRSGKSRKVKKPTKIRAKKKNSKKKIVKKLKVSKFGLEKNISKDEFFMDSNNDTPILNFEPNFLINQTDINDLLDQAEINDQDSILMEDLKKIEGHAEKNEELEKLINNDYVLAENIIGDSNYKLKIKEDNVAVQKSKNIQKKSQYLVNLRNNSKEISQDIILDHKELNISEKRTVRNISSSYFRELMFLISETGFFKFAHFFGKNIIAYFFYLFGGINFILKNLINFFFSILLSINTLGAKISKLINKVEEEENIKEIPKKSFKDIINDWREKLVSFNLISTFRFSTTKTYSKVLSFLLICLLIVSSIQVMALMGRFNSTKGKVLGISEQAFGDFGEGIKSMANSDFNNAKNSFLNANQKFMMAEKEISRYNNIFIEILKFIPQEGKKLDYGIKLLNAGRLFSEAAEHISLALEQQEEEIKLTNKLEIISNHLKQSKDRLKQVARDINSINLKSLPKEYREKFGSIQDNIPLLINSLEDLDSLLDVIADILGTNNPKRYLMLFQNSNELRPTGGFMGSLALVDIKEGKIEKVNVPQGGPYDFKAGFFENIISPKPLWLINPNFNFWDANWFVDFPTSSELILKYWEKSGGPTVDGVITINSNVMVEFLKIIGPISLEERGRVFDSNNFIQETQKIVEIEDVGEAPKAVIGEMMTKILDKVFNDQNLDYLQTLKLFNDSMKNKDIQIYFSDSSLESVITNYGWGGVMTDTSGDYLAVINTNIGGGKTDAFVKEKLNHDVNVLSNGTIIDTLKIERKFIPEKDNIFSHDINKTYLRIYVPQGAKLLEARGFEDFPEEEYMVPAYGSEEDEDIKEIQGRFVIDEISGVKINNEFNKTVFSGWQELGPGEKKVIVLRYELPFKLNLNQNISFVDKFFKKDENLNLDTYTVFYEKQSGKNSELNLNYNWSESIDLVWSNIPKENFKMMFNENKVIGFILKK
jgi:hypothetical protein